MPLRIGPQGLLDGHVRCTHCQAPQMWGVVLIGAIVKADRFIWPASFAGGPVLMPPGTSAVLAFFALTGSLLASQAKLSSAARGLGWSAQIACSCPGYVRTRWCRPGCRHAPRCELAATRSLTAAAPATRSRGPLSQPGSPPADSRSGAVQPLHAEVRTAGERGDRVLRAATAVHHGDLDAAGTADRCPVHQRVAEVNGAEVGQRQDATG
jgi:hypothetical protein